MRKLGPCCNLICCRQDTPPSPRATQSREQSPTAFRPSPGTARKPVPSLGLCFPTGPGTELRGRNNLWILEISVEILCPVTLNSRPGAQPPGGQARRNRDSDSPASPASSRSPHSRLPLGSQAHAPGGPGAELSWGWSPGTR